MEQMTKRIMGRLLAEMKACHKEIIAEMRAWRKEIKLHREVTDAYAGKMKANPEEVKSVWEHQCVRKYDVTIETIGAQEDRHLVVGPCRQTKKRTQGDGGSRQKLATARRRTTRHAVPARRKVGGNKGQRIEKRRRKGPEWGNRMRTRGARRQLRQRKKRASGRMTDLNEK
jgi:hypothetical protein